MTLILSGTDGLSDVDGTAATPAIRGTDTNTGIYFPAADTIAFSEGGVESMRLDSSGNLGIGTSSPAAKLDVRGVVRVNEDNAGTKVIQLRSDWAGVDPAIQVVTNNPLLFVTNGSERARIDSSGRLLVGKTSAGDFVTGVEMQPAGAVLAYRASSVAGIFGRTDNGETVRFTNNGNTVGTISTTGSATAYNTSSDYRLKHDIAPMTGALAKVAALKPCTYKWKADGSDGEGFIAHELQAVCPDAVTGEKDAVDAEGKPIYQGIDTSFLVATLTAAIQEQQAIIQSLTARIEALEGK